MPLVFLTKVQRPSYGRISGGWMGLMVYKTDRAAMCPTDFSKALHPSTIIVLEMYSRCRIFLGGGWDLGCVTIILPLWVPRIFAMAGTPPILLCLKSWRNECALSFSYKSPVAEPLQVFFWVADGT